MLDRHAWGRAVRLLSWIGVVAAIFWSRPASAYPWMIRHEYQGCVPCHADPSGAGLVTEYGRAMGENILRSRYGSKPPDEPPAYARFAFGVPTPDWLILGGSVRNGIQLLSTPNAGAPAPNPPFTAGPFGVNYLQMEADLKAQITVSRFRAYGSIGYQHEGAQYTQLTSRTQDNLVSREHWVGVDLGEDKQFLLRAGRIDVPFGIRQDEHDLMVRSTATTRTNINESQQHGIALAYTGQVVRGEVMALLGNYQLNPDTFRERGYSAFVEVSVKPWAALGASSLVTYAATDVVHPSEQHVIRQVHGVFARLVPVKPLVILTEVDALITTSDTGSGTASSTVPGGVGMVQADIEPTQGLHVVLTGEAMATGGPDSPNISFDGWAGLLWFCAPHTDIRVDFVGSKTTGNPNAQIYILPQLHFYL
jgi:hypothetical protein